jgi:carbamoyltransferase
MIKWGISANSHDAAIAVFDNDKLVYASHSERYSRVKNDGDLDIDMVSELKRKFGEPDRVIWYEKPLVKTWRQFTAGQGIRLKENNIKRYLLNYGIDVPVTYKWHHESHAAAGYYTSSFDEATIVVIDAIGEFESLSFWQGRGNKMTKLWSQSYPHSIGLWYSAMTDRIGLKANEEEYILMGMAALGDHRRLSGDMLADFVILNNSATEGWGIGFKNNLHRGCKDWRLELTTQQDMYDIAAATQHVYELIFHKVMQDAVRLGSGNKNLVLMGGCALNCVANSDAFTYFKNVWIMPNPGDAGSAIGAVLADNRTHIAWPGAYLGHDMGYKNTNGEIIDHLLEHKLCGLARGRAEYGPRSLGNRSLIADPRGADVKARLNTIKHREEFRPFAPSVLAEYADEIFEMPTKLTPYMQYAVKCKRPDLYPAIVHFDGTSRVQTVTQEDNPQFHALLTQWHARTGCPMLVNTSLNIKGEPIVNTHLDADRWENKYGVTIFR